MKNKLFMKITSLWHKPSEKITLGSIDPKVKVDADIYGIIKGDKFTKVSKEQMEADSEPKKEPKLGPGIFGFFDPWFDSAPKAEPKPDKENGLEGQETKPEDGE